MNSRYTRITAPYGFVPVAEQVVFPHWLEVEGDSPQAPPVHDVPFSDGISGTLRLQVEAETPIFIRGSKDNERFFELSDGVYAIPGTSLRGALRNVVEIASFGRLDRVNDHRYAVRDLRNRYLYIDHMAAILKDPKTGRSEPTPLVSAGWLTRRDDDKGGYTYHVEVCDFGKLEYQELMDIAASLGVRNFYPGQKQSSVSKYKKWGGANRKVKAAFFVRRPQEYCGRKFASSYGVATMQPRDQNAPRREGEIVFTGQPANWRPDNVGKRFGAGNAKHHDFVFFPQETPQVLDVKPETYADFLFAHSDRGQQNRLGTSKDFNEELSYLHWDTQKNVTRIPVFFLHHGNTVTAMGLALMFRLSYKLSIKQAIANASKDHANLSRLDLAEGIFGTVTDNRQRRGGRDDSDRSSSLALKGRVGISHAIAEGSPQIHRKEEVVLGNPKASYYPNYVEQEPPVPGAPPPRGNYKTWMDPDARPRGWKRYHAMTETWQPPLPTNADGRSIDTSRVGSVFHPLKAGTRFHAHIDVHNLRPIELGALLWALDFGASPTARHTLGMARPLGFGRVKMSIVDSDLYPVVGGHDVSLDTCRQAYVDYMSSKIANWARSPQIIELQALAQPVNPNEHRYQRLDPNNRINEFADGKDARLALPASGRHAAPASATGTSMANRMQSAQASPAQRLGPPPPGSGQPSPPKRPIGGGTKPWTGKPRGTELEVVLTELNRKGRWRCVLVDHAAEGTVTGTIPDGKAAGQRVIVFFVGGADPKNLELSWGQP